MIGTIRKHSTWLWVVIIGVTIVTFVFWGSQTSNQGNGRGGSYGSIKGHTITRDDFLAAYREVELHYFYTYGSWPDNDAKRSGFDVDRETYFRLLFIQKQKELNITVSEAAVAALGDRMLRGMNRGNPVPLEDFVAQVLRPHGLTELDFMRFLRHNLVIQQLLGTAGAGGRLVTPQEIRSLYEREHREMSVVPVFFPASNYLSRVTVTPEEFDRFYTNQMARYHLPERVQVTYVAFAASNFMAEATQALNLITNLEERIEATYHQFGTNTFKDAKTPEEAKAKIRQLMLEQQALLAARKKANAFANTLYEMQPQKIGNLAKLAREQGLEVYTSEPFSREEAPAELMVGESFTKAAFALSADDPIAGPLPGGDTVYEVELDKRLPAENPPLEKVRNKVMADCKLFEAIQQARAAGTAFHAQATNSLAKGRNFADVCKQAGVVPGTALSFSLSTRELSELEAPVNLNIFKQVAFSTPPGHVSIFVPSETGGFLVFVQAKLPVDQAKMEADLPMFTANVRRARESEALNRWFSREAEVGLRNTPLARQQQQPPPGDMPAE